MTTASPYRGLAPFEDSELDALFFFGRERDSEVVVANLIASRFTVLYGASGVGKSSLLLASVARTVRELPEQPLVIVFSSWNEDPERGLTAAVAEAAGVEGGALADVVERAQADRDVYVIVDQAEEYFVYHGENTAFEEALAAIVTRPLRVNVLLSLREDTLARLDRLKALLPNLFANVLRLDRLDRASGRAAIVRPLERWSELEGEHVEAEEALVDDVLDGVGTGRIELGPGAGQAAVERNGSSRIEAPYLQLVMQRLWEVEREAGSTTLRAATLEALGGAGQVVADHLERAIETLTPAQQALAAVLFDHLVTPSGTKIAHEASDLAEFTGAPEAEVRPVLASLVESRIVRTDEGGRYEIFHDVLAGAVLGWKGRFRAEQALARERSRRRRAVAVAAVALAAVGLMTAVTAYALSQRATAQDQARVANARQLQSASADQLQSDPELGLLLAAEALRLDPTASSEHAVREALLASRARGIMRQGPVTTAAYSPDGATVVTGGEDGVARVYDRRGQNFLRELRHGAPVTAVAFLPDGTLATAGKDGIAIVWDAAAGAPLRRLRHGGGPIRSLAVSADGKRLVTGGRDGSARVWDTASGRLVATLPHPKAVDVVRVSPDGRLVATGAGDRFARVWEAATGRLLYSLDQGGFVEDVAFSPDGDELATAGANRTARLWDVRTGSLRRELEGHRGRVLSVAFGPRGNLVATASTDGTARIWRVSTGALTAPLVGHRNLVLDVAFSPDGNWVVTSSADGTARTWTTEDGHPRATLVGHRDPVRSASFSPRGDEVLTVGGDGTARVWDGGTTPELAPVANAVGKLAGNPARVVSTPDGEITARAAGKTIVLDTPEGNVVLRGHDDRVNALAVSPDGTLLASASRDHDLRLWELPSGRLRSVLKGHFGSVADVRFSPDGRWLVSAGPITAGLWPIDGSDGVTLLNGPTSRLRAAAFTPDGRGVVTREADGTARRWTCDICGGAEELRGEAEQRLDALGRALTADERQRYLG